MEREADASEEYVYDGKFQGNILVVGRTGCGKTTFIQKLGKNRMFGEEIADVFWVSKIRLTKERERAIRDSFEGQEVHFTYPRDIDDFDYLIDNFAQDKSEYVDDDDGTMMGENLAITRLIVMDNVSGLVDKSDFALVNKSLDTEPSTSLSDGIPKRQLRQLSERDLSNGPETTESTTTKQPARSSNSDRCRPRGEFDKFAGRK